MTDTPGAGTPREAKAPDLEKLRRIASRLRLWIVDSGDQSALWAIVDDLDGLLAGVGPAHYVTPCEFNTSEPVDRSPSVPVSKLRELSKCWGEEWNVLHGWTGVRYAEALTALCDAAERAQEQP